MHWTESFHHMQIYRESAKMCHEPLNLTEVSVSLCGHPHQARHRTLIGAIMSCSFEITSVS